MLQTIELPLVGSVKAQSSSVPFGVLPLSTGKTCGSGCDTDNGDRSHASEHQPALPESVQIPFAKRRLNLDSVPSHGMPIPSIDMDLTVECNLRCTYCFKEKWNEHMEEQVAFDAIVWLIQASAECHVLKPQLVVRVALVSAPRGAASSTDSSSADASSPAARTAPVVRGSPPALVPPRSDALAAANARRPRN